jgi:hypothetical protein
MSWGKIEFQTHHNGYILEGVSRAEKYYIAVYTNEWDWVCNIHHGEEARYTTDPTTILPTDVEEYARFMLDMMIL